MLNMPRIKPITEESGYEKTRLVILSESVKSAGKGFVSSFIWERVLVDGGKWRGYWYF